MKYAFVALMMLASCQGLQIRPAQASVRHHPHPQSLKAECQSGYERDLETERERCFNARVHWETNCELFAEWYERRSCEKSHASVREACIAETPSKELQAHLKACLEQE